MPYADPVRRAAYKQQWAEANRDKTRAAAKKWRESHPELFKARIKACWRANPESLRSHSRRRRLARAGIQFVVRVESDVCGVCGERLTSERAPHPLSTEIGHEPPLAVARREGWRIIAERPEHRRCNRWKADRLDCQLPVPA